MDREFTWNRVEPNETPSYGNSRQAEIDGIKSKIESLKAERAQLVAQLGDEYSDERLGAQMLRAGDDGAMYKFLRGQQDQMKLNAAENDKNSKPTQEDFDKLLETLYATEGAVEDEKNAKPGLYNKYTQLASTYRARLNEMLAKNPSLSLRGYDPQGGTGKLGNSTNGVRGGDLYELRQSLGWNGSTMTDAEIDAEVEKYKGKVDVDELNKVADEAKKRNETAYDKYKKQIDADNARMKSIYDAYVKTKDTATALALESLLGSYLDPKTRNFKKKNYLSKDKWIKGK